jgi:hypothetical protein
VRGARRIFEERFVVAFRVGDALVRLLQHETRHPVCCPPSGPIQLLTQKVHGAAVARRGFSTLFPIATSRVPCNAVLRVSSPSERAGGIAKSGRLEGRCHPRV